MNELMYCQACDDQHENDSQAQRNDEAWNNNDQGHEVE